MNYPPADPHSPVDSYLNNIFEKHGSFYSCSQDIPQTSLHVKEKLVAYDIEISRLERQLVDLKRSRKQFEAYLATCHALSSSIHCLPTELLIHIFTLSCDTNRFYLWDGLKRRGPHTPFILSAVCYRWRQVALATPAIWASLDISFPIKHAVGWAPGGCWDASLVPPAIRLCSERASQAPLNIRLRGENIQDLADGYGVMSDLIRLSHKWCSLHFNLDSYQLPVPPAFWSNANFSNLRSLRTNDFNLFHFAPFLGHAPLEELILEQAVGSSEYMRLLETPLNWTRITTLNLVGVYMSPDLWWVEVIGKCTELRHLSFDNIFGEPEDLGIELESGPCTLEKVESLTLHLINDAQINGLFDVQVVMKYFNLPSLKSLSFVPPLHSNPEERTDELSGLESPWPIESFKDFFSRSECSLTSLHFDRVPITDAELLAIISLVPSLVELQVEEVSTSSIRTMSDRFLQVLSLPPAVSDSNSSGSFALVPNLRHMLFRVCGLSFDPDNLLKMGQRWKEQIALNNSSDDFQSMLRSLKIFVTGGGIEATEAFESLMSLGSRGFCVEILDV